MAALVKDTRLFSFSVVLLWLCGACLAESSDVMWEGDGLDIQCGEVHLRITVRRRFFQERRVPFKPEHLQLGAASTQRRPCRPEAPVSGREMVISAGLRECGTESSVHGEWLVYSNQLFLLPAVVPTSTGSVIVRGATTVVPVECHYNSSSVYQQGEAVFLEASVEAPLHPTLTLYVDSCVATLKSDPLSLPSYKFITNHGCHMDSVLPGSSSKFFLREQNNRLCFSVQAFRFNQKSGEQFISCHLRATLKPNSHSHLDKACFFHRPTFSWRATEGDSAPCECCDSVDCFSPTAEKNGGHAGHRAPPETEKKHEADKTVGPLHTVQRSHWSGHLSVNY